MLFIVCYVFHLSSTTVVDMYIDVSVMGNLYCNRCLLYSETTFAGMIARRESTMMLIHVVLLSVQAIVLIVPTKSFKLELCSNWLISQSPFDSILSGQHISGFSHVVYILSLYDVYELFYRF